MEIATFKVPASNELEVINTSTLIKGLTGSKVISVKIEFEKSENEKWWHVIVMYESPYTPPPPPPLSTEQEKLKKALNKWVDDATAFKNYSKKHIVSCNMSYLLNHYKEISKNIEYIRFIQGVGQKKFEMYGQELYDVIKQAVTEANADEPDETED